MARGPSASTQADGYVRADVVVGSALRMDRGVETLMRLAGLTLAEAVTMATLNPRG